MTGVEEGTITKEQIFITDLLRRAKMFISLKSHNRVEILLSVRTTQNSVTKRIQPALLFDSLQPVTVRIKISNNGLGIGEKRGINYDPCCEWRFATASSSIRDQNELLSSLIDRIYTQLENDFGRDGFSLAHNIRARMVMREPLGVMGVIEGISSRVDMRTTSIDCGAFTLSNASMELHELSETLL
jgi:hypothetical protein